MHSYRNLLIVSWFLYFSAPLAASDCPEEPTVADLSGRSQVTFLTFGDFGYDTPDHRRLASLMKQKCQEQKCDFAITVGDNIYESGVRNVDDPQFKTKFEDIYKIFGRFDFWMILGNHDVRGNAQAQVDYTCKSERWRMPARSYLVPKLPSWIKIYGFDTSSVAKKTCAWPLCSYSDDLKQLKENLCGGSGWKFMFGHHPIVTAGRGFDEKNGARMQERVLPLIGQCGVQFYYAGHDHHQEHVNVDYKGVKFHQIIQGAASDVKGKDPKNFVLGKQHLFAKSEYGFSITTVMKERMKVHFFNINGDVIYTYSTSYPGVRP